MNSSCARARIRLTDKSQVLHPPVQVRLGLWAHYAARDAGSRHCSEGLQARSRSDAP
jgi:hypothetical protein